MPDKRIQRSLTQLGVMSSHPSAFLILAAYAAFWLAFDRASLDFHGAATLVTWGMTLLIQRAEHRDTQAIQAKLDEILRTQGGARSDLAEIDKEEASDIEQRREAASREDERR